jgi:hypothetical protein
MQIKSVDVKYRNENKVLNLIFYGVIKIIATAYHDSFLHYNY